MNTKVISWGQLFILVGVLVLFLFTLTARVEFEKEQPPQAITGYVFRGNTIASYTGTNPNLVLPTSYSLGEVKEYYSGTQTFQYQWQAWNFWQEHYAVGAEGYYDFYQKMYSEIYPWTYEYTIGKPTYIEGNDVTITTTEWNAFQNNETIQSVYIPKELGELGVGAFRDCKNLKEVVFEEGCLTVADSCFWGCTSLKKVTLPNTITRIWAYAFFNCGLETITLPASLEGMHIGTFCRSANLKVVKIESTKITANYSEVYPHFGECYNLQTIYVPNSALSYYKTTSPWSYEADKIVGF